MWKPRYVRFSHQKKIVRIFAICMHHDGWEIVQFYSAQYYHYNFYYYNVSDTKFSNDL